MQETKVFLKWLQSDGCANERQVVAEDKSSHRRHNGRQVDIFVVGLLGSRRAHRERSGMAGRHGGRLVLSVESDEVPRGQGSRRQSSIYQGLPSAYDMVRVVVSLDGPPLVPLEKADIVAI